jgi:hypothetical protein
MATYDPTLITKFDATNNKYAYMDSDATHAFRSPIYDGSVAPTGQLTNPTRVRRAVVYLKPDWVFVHDWLDGTNAAYNKQFWQFFNLPTVSSNVITHVNGGQALKLTSVIPSAPTVTITQYNSLAGGNGFCEWNGKSSHYTYSGQPGYQVQLASNIKTTTETYLTAFDMSGANSTVALTGVDANHEGAIIQASPNPKIAIFPKVGAGTSASVSFTGPAWSGTAGIGVIGLVPGSVTIAGNCTANCNGTVGADGFWYYEATSGASSLTSGGCAITTSTPLHSGTTNAAYSPTVQETTGECGAGTPAWSITSGNLPPGLSVSSGGVVSGTPTLAGTFNFTASVSGLASTPAPSAQQITINTPAVCSIASTSPFTSGNQNVAYSFTIKKTNCVVPVTWTVTSGALPTGLSLGSSTGTISGTPSAEGTYTFTPQVTDNLGNSASLPNAQIVIAPPAPLVGGSTSNVTTNGMIH